MDSDSGLAALLAEERGAGLERLAGSRVHATVPLRDALVALVIARMRLPPVVRSVQIRFLPDSRILVEALVRVLGFSKRMDAVLRVEDSMRPGPPRTIRLAFAERSFLSSAAGLAGSLLGSLGPGVEIRDGIVTIDLDRLASVAGVADLAEHVREIRMTGQEGVLWVEVEAEVGHPSTTRPAPGGGGPGSSGRAAHGEGLDPEVVAPLLEGLRARARVRVAESLANGAIEALAGDIRRAASEGPAAPPAASRGANWKPLLRSLPPPRVRFETGALVIEAEVSL